MKRLNHLLLGLGLAAVLGGGLLVCVISDRSTRPLTYLAEGVRALERGDFAYPLESDGGDEVAQVTRAFEDMRSTLQRNEEQRQQHEEQRQHLEGQRQQLEGQLRRRLLRQKLAWPPLGQRMISLRQVRQPSSLTWSRIAKLPRPSRMEGIGPFHCEAGLTDLRGGSPVQCWRTVSQRCK